MENHKRFRALLMKQEIYKEAHGGIPVVWPSENIHVSDHPTIEQIMEKLDYGDDGDLPTLRGGAWTDRN